MFATLKPYKGERHTVELSVPIPRDLPEGSYEAGLCDASNSLRRRFRNEPGLSEPRDINNLVSVLRLQTSPRRTSLYLHVPLPERGLAVQGQSLPNLPGSVRAVLSTSRQTQEPTVRADLIGSAETPWVIEGTQSLKFTVVKDAGLSLK
ncbi:MAG: hypothetical protein LC745_08480 [Planctomycetia bacterium]|nr:hypothetical protein [Planctomycetia bacterium]